MSYASPLVLRRAFEKNYNSFSLSCDKIRAWEDVLPQRLTGLDTRRMEWGVKWFCSLEVSLSIPCDNMTCDNTYVWRCDSKWTWHLPPDIFSPEIWYDDQCDVLSKNLFYHMTITAGYKLQKWLFSGNVCMTCL